MEPSRFGDALLERSLRSRGLCRRSRSRWRLESGRRLSPPWGLGCRLSEGRRLRGLGLRRLAAVSLGAPCRRGLRLRCRLMTPLGAPEGLL